MKNLGYVNVATGFFQTLIDSTNQLLIFANTEVVSVNSYGAITVGNGYVNGFLGANTITAQTIQGGNTTVTMPLTIVSNTTFNTGQVNCYANVYIFSSNVFVNAPTTVQSTFKVSGNTTITGSLTVSGNTSVQAVNLVSYFIGNSTVNSYGNSTFMTVGNIVSANANLATVNNNIFNGITMVVSNTVGANNITSNTIIGNTSTFSNSAIGNASIGSLLANTVVISNSAGYALLKMNANSTFQTQIFFQTSGVNKWTIGKDQSDSFYINDVYGNKNILSCAANGVPVMNSGLFIPTANLTANAIYSNNFTANIAAVTTGNFSTVNSSSITSNTIVASTLTVNGNATVSSNLVSNNFTANVIAITNGGPETDFKLTSTSANGRDYWLISGGSSGTYSNGSFGIWDNTAGANRFQIFKTGSVVIPGSTSFYNTVSISGALTAYSVSTNNIVGSSVTVSNTTGYAINAIGISSFSGNATFSNNVTVLGNLNVSGNLAYNGIMSGNFIASGNGYSLGNTSIRWGLYAANADFAGPVTCSNTVTFNSNSTFNGDASFANATVANLNAVTLSFGSNSDVQMINTTVGTTGTGSQTVDSFAITSFRTAKYIIQVKDNVSNNFYASEIMTIHDGTNAYVTEFASITSNTYIGQFSVAISGGSFQLNFAPTSSNTTVKLTRTVIQI